MLDLDLRDVALEYHAKGWPPLPLPVGAKEPPPPGTTGYGGVDLTRAQIEATAWSGNIALRMPPDVVGLDFDHYRGGKVTFDLLVAHCGPLPNTWISHSGRDDGSGIRLFRAPRLLWVHALPGMEVIQASHRYTVVYPSMHPDGRRYGWWDQTEGGPAESLPSVEGLPELPWSWIAELSRPTQADVDTERRSYAVDGTAVAEFIDAFERADQPSYINLILDHFADHVNEGYSRHDTMMHSLLWALEHVRAGVAAAAPTLDDLASLWTRAVAGDARRAELTSTRRTTEWEAMVRHAVGKTMAKSDDEIARLHDEAAGPVMNVPVSVLEEESSVEDEVQPPDVEQEPSIFLDWSAFVGRDAEARRWLVDGFWPWGRAMALWAAAKTGKSELALWCAVKLALGEHPWTGAPTEPVEVVYLDFEMTEDDLDDRLSDFGFDPVRLEHLHYALLPALHALDDEKGGIEVEALVGQVGAQVVIIDTFGRAVGGDENSADTVRAFYRHTGSRLKRLGVAYLRTDHAGKDESKGQRGSSAKRDDVDVAWRMTRAKGGVRLDCSGSSRLSWVGPSLRLDRIEVDDVLSYSAPLRIGWPAGTETKVKELDFLSLPLDVSRRQARSALEAAGMQPGRNQVLAEALRFRIERGRHSAGTTSSLQLGTGPGGQPGTTSTVSALTRGNAPGPPSGTSGDQCSSPGGVPLRSIGADTGTTPKSPIEASSPSDESTEDPSVRAGDGEIEEAIETSPDSEAERKAAELEETWRRNEEIGRETGHVVTKCPGCGARAMTSILNSSGTSHGTKSVPWPKCRQCVAAPRVEPLGDVSLVRRLKPGHNPTQRQLAKRPAGDGFDWRPREDPPDPEAKGHTSE